jgi:hypothetical protein
MAGASLTRLQTLEAQLTVRISGACSDQEAKAEGPSMSLAEFVLRKFIPEYVEIRRSAGRAHFRAILKHILTPEQVACAFAENPEKTKVKLKELQGWPYLDSFRLFRHKRRENSASYFDCFEYWVFDSDDHAHPQRDSRHIFARYKGGMLFGQKSRDSRNHATYGSEEGAHTNLCPVEECDAVNGPSGEGHRASCHTDGNERCGDLRTSVGILELVRQGSLGRRRLDTTKNHRRQETELPG